MPSFDLGMPTRNFSLDYEVFESKPENSALVIVPPGWGSVETPHAGPAYLAGAAQKAGYKVSVVDGNYDHIWALCTDPRLRVTQRRVRADLVRLNANEPPSDVEAYAMTARLAALPVEEAEGALKAYNSWLVAKEEELGVVVGQRYTHLQFGEDGRYMGRVDRFFSSLAQLDMSYVFGLVGDGPSPADRLELLRRAAQVDKDQLPTTCFDGYVVDRVIPHIRLMKPLLVGISMNSSLQVEYAVRLAAWISTHCPEVPVLLGGNQVHFSRHLFEKMPWLADIVDGLVAHEGEDAFVGCLKNSNRIERWAQVPNVRVYQDGELREPSITRDVNPEVFPDYSGVISLLDRPPYPSRRRELVLGRGCYWAGAQREGCWFCTHYSPLLSTMEKTGKTDYRAPGQGFPLEVLRALQKQGHNSFYFVDETMTTRLLKELAKGIAEFDLDVVWSSYLRFERPYESADFVRQLRDAGCRKVEIGLESACDRLLKLMDKGITMNSVRKAMDNFLAAGIQPTVFIMFGFPTETDDEAEETLAFMREYAPRGVLFAPGVFSMEPGAPVTRHREELGIELLVSEKEFNNTSALYEGVHYRSTIGNSRARSVEFFARAMEISVEANRPKQIDSELKLVLNAFCGTVSSSFPELLAGEVNNFASRAFIWTSALTLDVVGPTGPADLVPSSHKVVLKSETAETHAVYVLNESVVISNEVLALMRQFASPTTMSSAIERFCAERALDPAKNKELLREAIESLITRHILVICG